MAGLAAMIAALLGLWRTDSLFSSHPAVIAGQAAAVLLMVWARLTFGMRSFHPAANPTAGGLVTTGPFRFIRHPIYASVCLFLLASVLGHFSALAVGFGALGLGGVLLRIFCEERLLTLQYPEYGAYAARTRRLLPGVW